MEQWTWSPPRVSLLAASILTFCCCCCFSHIPDYPVEGERQAPVGELLSCHKEAPVWNCKAMSFFPVNLVISCFRAQESERVSREWIKFPMRVLMWWASYILYTIPLVLLHHAVQHSLNRAVGLMLPPVYQPGLVPSWHVLAPVTSRILLAQATTSLINSTRTLQGSQSP